MGIKEQSPIGKNIYQTIEAFELNELLSNQYNTSVKRFFIDNTQRYVDININMLQRNSILYASMKDVTDEVNYGKQLQEMREETLNTTNEVIKKQMRTAQEIASLLGETTAETKVALTKLKQMLQNTEEGK